MLPSEHALVVLRQHDSNMQADDVLLFKFHDSDHSVTWRCPHTAFHDPSFPDAKVRESIEVRSVAFWE